MSSEVNNAKMREALEFIKQYFDMIDPFNINTYTFSQIEVEHINENITAALALPPRNCDVGTAEEQAHRFHEFCMEHQGAIVGMCNHNCPCLDSGDQCHCLCKWAQMPYTEGGAK